MVTHNTNLGLISPSCLYSPSQTLRPAVSSLRSSVDKAVSQREQNIQKFCAHLDKDIEELGREVKEIKNQAQVSLLDTRACRQRVPEDVDGVEWEGLSVFCCCCCSLKCNLS